MKYLIKIPGALTLLIMMALTLSCAKDSYYEIDSGSKEGTPYTPKSSGRISTVGNRNVMIMVSGGKNSLAGFLKSDINDLIYGDPKNGKDSFIPGDYPSDNVLMVLYRNGYSSSASAPTYLYRVSKDKRGVIVLDTLKQWQGVDAQIFGNTVLKEALILIKERIPAKGYGLVVSSHGTGYLPDGYYADAGEEYERTHSVKSRALRSLGQDMDPEGNVEMELKRLRESIPYHMDYILMDACFMGGVETAYELKDKTDLIGFSQTEILAEGFDYFTITTRLLKDEPSPLLVCEDYFNQYKDLKPSAGTGATISLVRTGGLDNLAQVCKELFQKYRTEISEVDANKVQRYWRNNLSDGKDRPYFYDLKDILAKSGVSEEDMAVFDTALASVVMYEAHTDVFMNNINLTNCCGLSMFIPNMGNDGLKNFYRDNIGWNTATQLVN